MKPGLHFSLFPTLIFAAALAAAPALAQHSVSGTIAAKPGTAAAASAASNPAAAAAVSAADPASAKVAPAETPAAAAAPAPAATSPLALTIPTPPPSPSASSGSLLQTTFALLFVLVLLVGLAWLLKRYGPKGLGGGGNNTVRLVGALNVGARERILVVEVGQQWIVVGASPGRMNALATMPRQEHAEGADAVATALPGSNFAEWFKQTIDKRNGNK